MDACLLADIAVNFRTVHAQLATIHTTGYPQHTIPSLTRPSHTSARCMHTELAAIPNTADLQQHPCKSKPTPAAPCHRLTSRMGVRSETLEPSRAAVFQSEARTVD